MLGTQEELERALRPIALAISGARAGPGQTLLGDTTFESIVMRSDAETRRRYYRLAIADLVKLQRYTAIPDPSCIAFGRAFDYDLLLWELHHFREWLLEADRGARLAGPEHDAV